MPLDSPLLQDRAGRKAMASPGIGALREAFDITYAVHRMEEEGARRRAYNGPGGAGARGFLHGLNEEGEDDAEEDLEATKRRYGAGVAQVLAQQQAQAQANAAAGKVEPASTGTYQGWGGADRRMAEAVLYDGRAGPRDRGNKGARKAGFDLTLDNATLLGRRGRKPMESSPLSWVFCSASDDLADSGYDAELCINDL